MGNCWPRPVDNLPVTPSPSSGFHKPAGFNRRKPDAVETQNRNLKVQPSTPYTAVAAAAEAPTLPLPPPAAGNDGANIVAVASSSSGSSSNHTSPRTMKKFSYGELRTATRNFRPDTVLGEGGFGRVFKGWVDEKTYAPSKVGIGIPVAVKKSNPDSEQGLSEWQAEVKFLGKFSHPNLVKLIGYCWEDREFLLVYEYMQRGSLESHLFRKGAETLSWETRLRIMVDAARGLDFLHSTEKQVIYRDFKASNILLDLEFNAKLSDFGLAKLGPVNGDSHITTQVVGTYGYAAPEYMATGHLYVKSDVYGFGVVLLEILSGRRVLDTNRPAGEHNLVDWARPLLPEKRRLRQLMDLQLEGQYPLKAVTQIADLILKCLEPDPKKRPGMDEVLEILQNVSSIQVKPKAQSSKEAQKKQKTPGHRHHHHHPSPPPLRSKNPSANSMEAQARHKLPITTRSY